MRRIFALLLLVSLAVGLPHTTQQLQAMFAHYKKQYSRTYSSLEERKRFQCYVSNLHLIEERNKVDTATYVVNKFTDLCADEFRAKYLSGFVPAREHHLGASVQKIKPPLGVPNPPTSYDWRKITSPYLVGPVQDQGQCGSCWAFSAVAALEGAWNMKIKATRSTFVKLSEGYLNQCSNWDGCSGGFMADAIDYAIKYGGIPTAKDYPYAPSSGNCSMPTFATLKAAAKFWGKIEPPWYGTLYEPMLAAALKTHGPFSIAVDATALQSYGGGIISNCVNNGLNHGIAVVGVYGGTSASSSHWIVRNSWGQGWGESGYFRMAFGKNCLGMTTYPLWAVAL